MIPVIKDNIIIRNESQGAVIVDTDNDKYELIAPIEAFIFSLFDGTKTIYDIIKYIKVLKNAPDEKEILNDIYEFIKSKSNYVELIQHPLKKSKIQYNPFNFLYADGSLFKRPKRPEKPVYMNLYITKRCNLNCVYCFADAEYVCKQNVRTQNDEMSLDVIYKVIDQMAELGIKKTLVTGGEATLRKDLIKIIHRLTNYGIEVILPTNAYSMTDKLAKELKELGIKKVQTKLDAAKPETQDRLSGVNGSYERLIQGIKILKKFSFEVSTVAVATAWNIYEIPEVIKICVDLNVDEINPRIYSPGIWALNGRGGEYLNPSSQSIMWLEEQIRNLQEKYKGKANISSLNIDTLCNRKEGEISTCTGAISSCTILQNGLVVPCELLADFREDFIMGDVKKASIYDIWNSQSTREWIYRGNNMLSELCSSCAEVEKCKGGCPWKAIVSYGKWECDPFCFKAPVHTKIPFPKVEKII
ncbi:radical SAM additional 4Fe4S-binding SPASM domain protein [Clostridium argentinense CDC 2741]|uniref:Radical SAM additional 4Fe4S-binding SPASM domain protein n=1 Tax=Clostridium argentinense CDC 2741 TaxID=1418104 RepID=A0A0C1R3A4_9CLOT|nr:radical SAM protein [Clostridium argentinense]ARC86347.1 radical SAM/SPASM domain-containing protein [Clostridium argentinense]KIE44956.1 radical SAM additional 4Fe4S-binding SPASM domain protein [Clostridium argentinense CDC 2741]